MVRLFKIKGSGNYKMADMYLQIIKEISNPIQNQYLRDLINISPILISTFVGGLAGYISYKITSNKEARIFQEEELERKVK
jgi:hypothetical protein